MSNSIPPAGTEHTASGWTWTPAASAKPAAAPPARLTQSALHSLARNGTLNASAFEEALRFIKIRPGKREWGIFWRHALSLCGALFLAAGVIFFFAWNWAEMHHFLKFTIIASFLLLAVACTLVHGPDSLAGKLSLVVAALSIGPLLAVYGQTYQTGADMWELFRVWTLVLLPLAIAGRLAALWLLIWLTGSAWLAGWLAEMFAWRAISFGLAEFFIFQTLAIVAWEAAAGRWKSKEGFSWLSVRWLPRLMTFCVLGGLTLVMVLIILDDSWSGRGLVLPLQPTCITLYGAAIVGGWFWYRHTQHDLFMLGIGVLSLCTLLVTLMVKAEILGDEVYSLLLWGIIIAGLSAGAGHLLRTWQRAMEEDDIARDGDEAEPGFFDAFRLKTTWRDLWTHLSAEGLIRPDAPLPVAPPLSQPWYTRVILAFGGWVSAILLMAFLATFIGVTLKIRNFEGPLLFFSLIFCGLGEACLRQKGVFAAQFGLALVMSGTAGAASALALLVNSRLCWSLLVAAAVVLPSAMISSRTQRYLALTIGGVLLFWGVDAALFSAGGVFDRMPPESHMWTGWVWTVFVFRTLWWSAACAIVTQGWLREKDWISRTTRAEFLPPLLYGLYTALIILFLFSFVKEAESGIPAFQALAAPRGALGLGAAVGLVVMAAMLTRDLPRGTSVQPLYMTLSLLTLPAACFLPGVTVALLGLAISRYRGDKVWLGISAAFLASYITYYYYNLTTTLLHKSLTLMSAGVALLVIGLLVQRFLGGGAEHNAAPAAGGIHA